VIPAIAIPVRQKPESGFECPDKHIEILKTFMPSVRKLVLIGWAGKEKVFLEMLRASLPKSAHAIVVGKDEDDAKLITNGLLEEGIPGSFEASVAKGFTGFIENGLADEFLSR
jgi:hypothetical protein